MRREEELVKNTAIIVIGRVATQFISFFLLPLYTAYLSTVEYGEVDLNNTIRSLIIPIVTLMIEQAVYVYMLEGKKRGDDCSKFVSTGIIMTTVQCLIFLIVFIVIVPWVSIPYQWYLCINVIATAYSGLFLQIARGFRDISTYSLGSVITSLVTIFLNIVCIVWLGMGPRGMLIATFFGNVACIFYIFVKEKIYKYVNVNKLGRSNIISFIRYSLPLIPNQLSIWLITASDRLIVASLMGNHFTGILAVVHKFPQVFNTAFNIFHISWTETVILHINDDDNSEFLSKTISKIISMFAALAIAINVGVSVCFEWLVDKSYYEAYYQIPISMLAVMCNVVVGLLGAVYVAKKETTKVAKTTISAGIINAIVHLLLINYIDLYAASVSTLVGYGTMMVYRYADVQKYVKIIIDKKTILKVTILYLISCGVYYLSSALIRYLLSSVILIIILYINRRAIKSVIEFVKNRLKKGLENKNDSNN